jgi:glycosyltransferase involved in cell wall biosynthesis
METSISVIIPVKNELIHIERCVKSALRLTPNVFVVDSSSTDGTFKKAESLGAKVFNYKWDPSSNFSKKMNWALENLPIKTTWVIRLDADEYFLDKTIQMLSSELEKLDPKINALTLNRRVYFKGRWIKYGMQYPRPMVRVTRLGFAKYESRWLDEVVNVDGNTIVNLSLDFVDDNLNSISKWVKKHDNYAAQEAIEMIHQEIGLFQRITKNDFIGKDALKAKKEKSIYAKMPLFWRPFLYFLYRYFIKFGFLDGYSGFLWNFFQGWWYRTLVDVKIFEIKKSCGLDKEKIKKYIEKEFSIRIY